MISGLIIKEVRNYNNIKRLLIIVSFAYYANNWIAL